MKFKFQNKELNQLIGKFQEGGVAPEAAPVEETPAAPKQGGDPMEQILAACQQVVETQDCQLAIQVAQAILQMAGGGAPAQPAAPEGQAPVYGKGGTLKYWTSK